jgi:hypothetical protein
VTAREFVEHVKQLAGDGDHFAVIVMVAERPKPPNERTNIEVASNLPRDLQLNVCLEFIEKLAMSSTIEQRIRARLEELARERRRELPDRDDVGLRRR